MGNKKKSKKDSISQNEKYIEDNREKNVEFSLKFNEYDTCNNDNNKKQISNYDGCNDVIIKNSIENKFPCGESLLDNEKEKICKVEIKMEYNGLIYNQNEKNYFEIEKDEENQKNTEIKEKEKIVEKFEIEKNNDTILYNFLQHEEINLKENDEQRDDKIWNNYNHRRRGSSGIIESEYFKKLRVDNSTKIRNEILKIQNRAEKYFKNLFNISRNFCEIRENIYNKESNIFNYLKSIFPINIGGFFKKPNFFILAAEAWIIETLIVIEDYIKENVLMTINQESQKQNQSEDSKSIILSKFKKLKKDEIFSSDRIEERDLLVIDYPKNFTFSQILKKIKNLEINQENFLLNLSILTGTINNKSYASSTTKIIEKSIGNLFLKSLKEILHDLKLTQQHEDEEVDQKMFEVLFINILRKVVEKSINEMNADIFKNENYQKSNKNNYTISEIKYLDCYENLKEESKEDPNNFNLKQYINKIIKYYDSLFIKDNFKKNNSNNENYSNFLKTQNKDSNKDFSLKICAQSFFDFYSYNFTSIIDDINTFIREYNSFNFRLKNNIGKSIKNLYDINKKYIIFCKSIITSVVTKVTDKFKIRENSIENLYKYYYEKYPIPFQNLENRKENFQKYYDSCEYWLNNSCNFIKENGKNVYEEVIYKKYEFLNNKLFNPLLNLNNKLLSNFSNFVVIKLKIFSNFVFCCNRKMKEKISLIKKILTNIILLFYKNSNESFTIDEKLNIFNNTNDLKLVDFYDNYNEQYIVIRINKKITGIIISYVRNSGFDLINFFYKLYKFIMRKIFIIPGEIIKYSLNKNDTFKDYLKIIYESIYKLE